MNFLRRVDVLPSQSESSSLHPVVISSEMQHNRGYFAVETGKMHSGVERVSREERHAVLGRAGSIKVAAHRLDAIGTLLREKLEKQKRTTRSYQASKHARCMYCSYICRCGILI